MRSRVPELAAGDLAGPAAFSLTRWFTTIGLASILVLAVVGALLLSRLFVSLLPLVRRAQATIHDQQQRLVETETLAAMGDLGCAVVHGIRDPLAVIRTSNWNLSQAARVPGVTRDTLRYRIEKHALSTPGD